MDKLYGLLHFLHLYWILARRNLKFLWAARVEFHHAIYPRRYSSLWYGGTVATIHYDGWKFELVANGEVCCDLCEKGDSEHSVAYVHDKTGTGEFGGEMYHYLHSDRELVDALEHAHPKYKMVMTDSNWWECFPVGPDGYTYDLMWAMDSDHVFGAIDEIVTFMEQVIRDLTEDAG